MPSERFIIEQNIDRLHCRLQFEESGNNRDMIVKLLFGELDKIKSCGNRFSILSLMVARGRVLIDKQRSVVLNLQKDGMDSTVAENLLETLLFCQKSVNQYAAKDRENTYRN